MKFVRRSQRWFLMNKTVEAAQRIGGLWRVYVTSAETRAQLLCTGISLRCMRITLRDRNTYLLPGQEHEETTRLYVRSIPLYYDNNTITVHLKSMGIQILGSWKNVRARNKEGKLTNFKTGDRFVDIIATRAITQEKVHGPVYCLLNRNRPKLR